MKKTLFAAYRALLVRPFAGRGWATKLGIKKFQAAIWRRLLPEETAEFRGARFKFAPDDHVFSIALHSGRYEDFELDLLLSKLEPGMNVLDVGANIGIFSVLAARRLAELGGGTVYSVEADPDNFAFLSENIALNRLGNAIAVQKAASDKTETVQLHRSPDNKGGHSLAVEFGGASVAIQAAPLDAMIEAQTPIHLLKMDVEGWEVHALRGMPRILGDRHLRYIFIEYAADAIRKAGNDPIALPDELVKAGFDLFIINERDKILEPAQPEQARALAAGQLTNLLGVRR